jgi:hypothetical protein
MDATKLAEFCARKLEAAKLAHRAVSAALPNSSDYTPKILSEQGHRVGEMDAYLEVMKCSAPSKSNIGSVLVPRARRGWCCDGN